MSDIHSCSYFCTRPACVLAQRDELRVKQQAEPVHELVSDKEYLRLFEAARAGSDRRSGLLRGIRAVIAAYESATPRQAEPVRRESAPGEQPNALRIADELSGMDIRDMTEALADDAAAELRWLHAEIIQLEARERGRQIARSLNVQEPPDAKPKQAEPVADADGNASY